MNATTLSRPTTPARGSWRMLGLVDAGLVLLANPFALATRAFVAWQFLKSGLLKIGSWESTLGLFQDEYRVPLLPPVLAAIAGTAGELLFPVLLVLGLFGRLSALGLFAVNALAVVSYAHVLYAEGFEAAVGQHYLWGFMLCMLAIYGPGGWSVDRLLAARREARRRA